MANIAAKRWGILLALPALLAADSPADAERLAAQQKTAQERVKTMDGMLRRLLEKYKAGDADKEKAERIQKAAASLQNDQVLAEMEEVLRALEKGETPEALARAEKVKDRLAWLWETLTGIAQLERLKDLDEKAKAAESEIEKLKAEQAKIANEARSVRDRSVPRSVRELREKVDALAQEQGKLLAETSAAAGKPAKPEPGKPAQPGAPSEAEQQEIAKRQETLEAEARGIMKSMQAAAREQPKAAEPLQTAAARTASAASQMDQAGQAMKSKPSYSQASGMQRQAIEYLAEARKALAEAEREFLDEKDKFELERLRGKEQELAEKVKRIAKALQVNQEFQDAGKSAQKAADSMAVVEGLFRQEFVDSGVWESQRALEHLEEALASLRQTQRRYATQQSKVVLSKLQRSLDDLIDGERAILEKTARLDKALQAKGQAGPWERQDLKEAAQKQGELAKEAAGLRDELKDPRLESVVYALVLEQSTADMEKARDLLEKSDPGPYTQGLEEGAASSLEEMRNGLKELAGRLDEEDKRPPPRQMMSSGDSKQPLVTALDELRLLWSLEKRVGQRFQAAQREFERAKKMDPDLEKRVLQAADDQKKVRDMAKDFRLKIYQEQR